MNREHLQNNHIEQCSATPWRVLAVRDYRPDRVLKVPSAELWGSEVIREADKFSGIVHGCKNTRIRSGDE